MKTTAKIISEIPVTFIVIWYLERKTKLTH